MADLQRAHLPQRDGITGLVLAGGRGQRVGGRDKGLIEHAGAPLALQVLERLRPQVATVLISANRNPEIYAQWAPVVADETSHRFAGPIAGMLAALGASHTAWLAVVPCDLPNLPTDGVARLSAAVGAAHAAHAACNGRHALICLLHRETAPQLLALLERGERRIGAMLTTLGSVPVAFAADELVNLNAPADLGAHAAGR